MSVICCCNFKREDRASDILSGSRTPITVDSVIDNNAYSADSRVPDFATIKVAFSGLTLVVTENSTCALVPSANVIVGALESGRLSVDLESLSPTVGFS